MLKQVLDAYLHLLYPPACFHCEEPTTDSRIFCDSCSELLHLLNSEGRCQQCFEDLEDPNQHICHTCRSKPAVWKGIASAFEYAGPAAALVKRLKYGGQPHLALSAAAFLVAQLDQLQWPVPDVITPVPMPRLRQIMRGYNQSELIANELGRMFQVPVVSALSRASGDFAQAGLSFAQRQHLSADRFTLKRAAAVVDRVVLLVDDVFTTGTTLRCCAGALQAGCPSAVYALTVCRATL